MTRFGRFGCLLIVSLLFHTGCGGESVRRCIDHEECFAGEYCSKAKRCEAYTGTTSTETTAP